MHLTPVKSQVLLWAGAFIVLIGLRLPRIGVPYLGPHDFRQTQTAITAYWFREGISLPDYPLPVLGYPWTAPLEFPIFQLAMSGLHATSIPLDMAGRICGLVTFTASVAVMIRVLLAIGFSQRVVLAFTGFAALSPFGLIFGRACLIEFTAVLLALLYLVLALRLQSHKTSISVALVAVVAGSLAATTKVTTFPVFWAPVALVAVSHLWEIWGRRSNEGVTRFAWNATVWIAVLLVPLIAAAIWTQLTDEVKAREVMTTGLTSHNMIWWNFGSFAQRFDSGEWGKIGNRIIHLILPLVWPLAVIGLLSLRLRSRASLIPVVGLILGSLGVVLIFFNLYAVHDYYLCAIVFTIWMLAALGLDSISGLFRSTSVQKAAFLAPLIVILIAATFSDFVRIGYRDRSDGEIIRLARTVQTKTSHDAELVVFGDSWNSRILYYCRRKGLMIVDSVGSDAFASHYVSSRRVGYVIAHRSAFSRVQVLWPAAYILAQTETLALFSLEPAPLPTIASTVRHPVL